jgi:hypothetical protein
VIRSKEDDLRLARIVHRLVAQNADGKAITRMTSTGLVEDQCSPETIATLLNLHPGNRTPLSNWPPMPSIPIEHRLPAPSAEVLMNTFSKLQKGSAPGISGYSFEIFKQLLSSENKDKFEYPPTQKKKKNSNNNNSPVPFFDFSSILIEFFTILSTKVFHGVLEYRRLFTSSLLISLQKKPKGIRPIAIGETWVRIFGKLILKLDPILRDALINNTGPTAYVGCHQYGVLTRSGTEVVAHAIREAIQSGRAVAHLTLDFRNAYNDGDRIEFAERIGQLAPSHSPYFQWLYRHAASLFTVDRQTNQIIRLESSSGLRQGDVLASLWYCIGARAILDHLTDNFPLIEVFGYVDNVDILILKPPLSNDEELNIDHEKFPPADNLPQYIQMTVNEVLQHVNQVSSNLGIKLQPAKCSLFVPKPDHRPLQQDLPIPLHHDGSVVLGTPVGSDDFIREKVESILDEYGGQVMQAIMHLPIPKQDKMILLRSCVASIPMHLARTVSLQNGLTGQIFESWDTNLQEACAHLLHLNMVPSQLVDLPIRLGGFGLRLMKGLSSVAFPASLLQANMVLCTQRKDTALQCSWPTASRCCKYLNIALQLFPPPPEQQVSQEVVDNLLVSGTLPHITIPTRSEDGIQRMFSMARDAKKRDHFVNVTLSPRDRTLFADTSVARSWLHVRPTHPHMNIPDREFTVLARARALYVGTGQYPDCPCCKADEIPGNHPYSCRALSQWRQERHNFQVRLLQSYLPSETKIEHKLPGLKPFSPTAPSFSSSSSSSSLSAKSRTPHQAPRSTRRRLIADLLIPSSLTAFDVTIVATRPIHSTHLEAEKRAENHKVRKYSPALADGTIRDIIPVVIGPFGNIGVQARAYIDTNLPDFAKALKTRIALGVARGTARMIECWSRWTLATQPLP